MLLANVACVMNITTMLSMTTTATTMIGKNPNGKNPDVVVKEPDRFEATCVIEDSLIIPIVTEGDLQVEARNMPDKSEDPGGTPKKRDKEPLPREPAEAEAALSRRHEATKGKSDTWSSTKKRSIATLHSPPQDQRAPGQNMLKSYFTAKAKQREEG